MAAMIPVELVIESQEQIETIRRKFWKSSGEMRDYVRDGKLRLTVWLNSSLVVVGGRVEKVTH